MLTSAYILICASPQLRGHMPATSAQDGVTGQQAGMRHHGCKLNEVIALGGCKIMGSSLESSGLSGLTVKLFQTSFSKQVFGFSFDQEAPAHLQGPMLNPLSHPYLFQDSSLASSLYSQKLKINVSHLLWIRQILTFKGVLLLKTYFFCFKNTFCVTCMPTNTRTYEKWQPYF